MILMFSEMKKLWYRKIYVQVQEEGDFIKNTQYLRTYIKTSIKVVVMACV